MRVCELLNHVLRHYRHHQHVGLQLAWRPLYDMLQELYNSPTPHLKGESRWPHTRACSGRSRILEQQWKQEDSVVESMIRPGLQSFVDSIVGSLHPWCQQSLQPQWTTAASYDTATQLYTFISSVWDLPAFFSCCTGTFLEHVQQSSLFTLVARARRFFPPGAAAEVYGLLRSDLVSGDPMGTSTHMALGWLVLFFPTKQLPQVEPDTAQVSEALQVDAGC